ncbi:MAG: hypothetical protein ABIE07_13000 [Candidatus Zixiibacteriota bacterium]
MEIKDRVLQEYTGIADAIQFPAKSTIGGIQWGLHLGVLYGRHSVDICLVQNLLGIFRVRDVSSFPLDLIENSQSDEIYSKVIEIIKSYLYRNRLPAIPINLGLYGEHLAFRQMRIPAMPRNEIANAVLWEGEKLFPFKFKDCRVHFEIANKERDENKKITALDINITVAKNEIIENIYRRFESSGLKLGQVNFLPNFATKFLKTCDKNSGGNYLHIHINDNLSFAVFLQNNELSFYQQFMSWPFIDSSIKTGIANIESIVTELQSFIDIFIANSRSAKIDSIVISGINSNKTELPDYIQASIGIPCHYYINSTSKIRKISGFSISDLDKNLPAVANAMANPDEQPLAPDKIKQKIEKRKFYSRLGLIAAASLIITLGLSWFKHIHENEVETELNRTRANITDIENSPAYHTYLNIVGKLNQGKEFLRMSSDKEHSHFGVVVRSLSFDIPKNLNLTEIHTTQNENKYSMRLTGHVRIKDFSPEIVLAQYIKALEKYPYFSNINVISHNKRLKGDEFDLDFQILMDVQV